MKNETTNKKNNPITWVIMTLFAAYCVYFVMRPEQLPMEDFSAITCLSTSVIVFIQFAKTKNRRQLILGIFLAAVGILSSVIFLTKLIGA